MARAPTSTAVAEPITNNGLRFTNSAWNDTIEDGALFHLYWDQSLSGIDADLGLFHVSYLEEGVIGYNLALNLTDRVESRAARWLPNDLNETLYVFWLRTIGEEHDRWAISQPWTPRETSGQGNSWGTPIGIPIAIMMGIYVISLVTCLFYHRRRKARQEREKEQKELSDRHRQARQATLDAQRQRLRQRQQLNEGGEDLTDADRQPSVSSADTAQTLIGDDVQKPEAAIVHEMSPRRSTSRRPSQPDPPGSRKASLSDPLGSRKPSHPDLLGYRKPSHPDLVGSRKPSYPDLLGSRKPSHPDLLTPAGQSRRPSHPDLFGYVSHVSHGRHPSQPTIIGRGRRPSRPELFIDTRSVRRRSSRPELYGEISPGRRPSQPELLVDNHLPETEVGKAI